jgi:hypothetical protein
MPVKSPSALLLLLFLAFASSAQAQSNQDLWAGARAGMSPADVQAAFPNAHPVSDGAKMGAALIEKVAIDNTGYGASNEWINDRNTRFRAGFFFLDQKLYAVRLTYLGAADAMLNNTFLPLLEQRFGFMQGSGEGDSRRFSTRAGLGGHPYADTEVTVALSPPRFTVDIVNTVYLN